MSNSVRSPRKNNIRKLAEALHISVSYLLDESETDSQSHIDKDMFILEAKETSVPREQKKLRKCWDVLILCLPEEN